MQNGPHTVFVGASQYNDIELEFSSYGKKYFALQNRTMNWIACFFLEAS